MHRLRLKFGMWPPGGPWRLPCEFQSIWRSLRFWPQSRNLSKYNDIRPEMLTLVSLVRFGRVNTFLTSAEPQQFNSDIGVRNETRQRALWPVLWPDFLTLLPVVRIGHVIPFFTCTESEEVKSDLPQDFHIFFFFFNIYIIWWKYIRIFLLCFNLTFLMILSSKHSQVPWEWTTPFPLTSTEVERSPGSVRKVLGMKIMRNIWSNNSVRS